MCLPLATTTSRRSRPPAGIPIPGVELRIVDDGGGDLPAGGEGEILVRGYQVMLGYLDDPAATAATIDP